MFLDTVGKGCVKSCPSEDTAKPSAWGDKADKKSYVCKRCDAAKGKMTNCYKCSSAN